MPDDPTGVGVLTVAGSSGRIELERARLLAAEGALVHCIRWFGGPGQPPAPYEVGLETFIRQADALAAECDRVVLMGTSFGAEAMLLTASQDDQVDAVVAFAPSDVAWAGVDEHGRQRSHWTYGGEPLPFVPYLENWHPSHNPPAYRDLYRASREAAPDRAMQAAIPVQRVHDLVLIAGGDDQVWDAVDHAHRIADRRADHGLATIVLEHPTAGHRVVLPGESVVSGGQAMARGGSPEHDRELGRLAWPYIRALVGQHHPGE